MSSFEVKTNVPESASGRFVDAITDAIRPFTEQRGLRADQIRLQREDVLLQIAIKARKRAEIADAPISPVPNKLLVPLLEKASLESDDLDMQSRWAELIVSASTGKDTRHLTFVDILSRMSSEELKLLEDTCLASGAFPETSYPDGHFVDNRKRLLNHAHILVANPNDQQFPNEQARYAHFVSHSPLTYGRVMFATVASGSGMSYFYDRMDIQRPSEILERERLIEIKRLLPFEQETFLSTLPLSDLSEEQRVFFNRRSVQIGYFDVTYLGVGFVRACSPVGADQAAKRLRRKSG